MASDIDWQDKAQRLMALYERESAEYTRVALENVRLTALLAERDAAVARAESVIRKALNDLDHGSLWDARAALAAASEGE